VRPIGVAGVIWGGANPFVFELVGLKEGGARTMGAAAKVDTKVTKKPSHEQWKDTMCGKEKVHGRSAHALFSESTGMLPKPSFSSPVVHTRKGVSPESRSSMLDGMDASDDARFADAGDRGARASVGVNGAWKVPRGRSSDWRTVSGGGAGLDRLTPCGAPTYPHGQECGL
jgi:hypothetical protein